MNELKEKRDEISHPKFDVNKIKPITDLNSMTYPTEITYSIEPKIFLNGLISIRWYLRINGELLIECYRDKFSSFELKVIDMFLSKLILNVDKKYSLKIESLDKEINDTYKFSENKNKKLEQVIKILTSTNESKYK